MCCVLIADIHNLSSHKNNLINIFNVKVQRSFDYVLYIHIIYRLLNKLTFT